MSVKVNISGDGLEYTSSTTLTKAGQIISFLSANAENQTQNTTSQTDHFLPNESSKLNKSPREAIIESNAKTIPQKIVTFANYLREQEGKLIFLPSDIRNLFERAGESVPKNISRDFKTAIILNYIFENTNGEYVLTDKAFNELKNGFIDVPLRQKKHIKRLKLTVKKISDTIKQLAIITTMGEFPDFHQLNTKSKKILWIMIYTQKNNIESLTPSEIEYLADKLGDDISTKGFKALNTINLKNGYEKYNPSDNTYKILQKGIDYIKSQLSSE